MYDGPPFELNSTPVFYRMEESMKSVASFQRFISFVEQNNNYKNELIKLSSSPA